METISFILSVIVVVMCIKALKNHEEMHHIAAEIITLTVLVGVHTMDLLRLLDPSHFTAYFVGLMFSLMYLWGSLTEALSVRHKYFWLGYFTGLIGPVYVKVKNL